MPKAIQTPLGHPSSDAAETVVLTRDDIQRTLKRLAHELLEAHHGAENLVIVGIVTRGKVLAERMVRLLEDFDGRQVPQGVLDITLYRDDVNQTFKSLKQSHIPVDLTGKHVVLVDDVIFRGRTIRAALDALNDYGRPASVQLMVLLDRGHRELPIHPDFVGKNLPTSPEERVNVSLMETDGVEEVSLSRV